MRRLLLIANPSASGFTGAALRDVEATLGSKYEVTTAWPNGPAESRQAAADAAADGYAVVAAMGGDGVVHHVANGLAFAPDRTRCHPHRHHQRRRHAFSASR